MLGDLPCSGALVPSQLFSNRNGYTYNDYIILPGHISFGAADVSLVTQVTRGIKLNVPFVSSPMDTVTESQMAIHMALFGGMGIIHCNNSVEEQCDEVAKVKRFENGFILDPFVVGPDTQLNYLDEIKFKYAWPADSQPTAGRRADTATRSRTNVAGTYARTRQLFAGATFTCAV